MPAYRRPPITEAVIAISFEPRLDEGSLDKVHKRFLGKYPAIPQRVVTEFNFEITAEGPRVQNQLPGYKLTSMDGADLLLLFNNSLTTSRLAPYPGWDAFAAQARENWSIWHEATERRKIIRAGVRFINRIDIPNPSGGAIQLGDYSNIHPKLPSASDMPIMDTFSSSTSALFPDGVRFNLNFSSTPSPLVQTASLLLDIDVYLGDPPQKGSDLWGAIDGLRYKKNLIFENSITDRTRELFT